MGLSTRETWSLRLLHPFVSCCCRMERTISLQEGVHIVPPSGQLVGFTWADEERLLVTSTSQVVLCCVSARTCS